MSQLTTHILDTTLGKPAAGITITLYAQQGETWQALAYGQTNQDGRVADLLPNDETLPVGTYKMKFLTQEYFDQQGVTTFYPFVEIIFAVTSTEHYHVPLLLNPFGYSTYRGS
ncbi:5-hydroxyisourate hydrolase [Hymenobacter gelipurpurascens]|uniref:5-hydroxyisourate hydrolase n=1 Tax=Hymenobacter gelipurpurascens TaxID=89968 RepID=A0A212TFF1_9BACT|nr:hydroxyisourate hydrolase [Hymenobacter gelipurpurascens]SNC64733.1 5-hydroxyisourate hydrolase [Hymenobacter gelipurpurascens]